MPENVLFLFFPLPQSNQHVPALGIGIEKKFRQEFYPICKVYHVTATVFNSDAWRLLLLCFFCTSQAWPLCILSELDIEFKSLIGCNKTTQSLLCLKKKKAVQIMGAAARSLPSEATGSRCSFGLWCEPDPFHSCAVCSGLLCGSVRWERVPHLIRGEWGGVECRRSGRTVCSAAPCLRLFGAAVLSGICNQIPFPVPQLEFAASFPGNETLN